MRTTQERQYLSSARKRLNKLLKKNSSYGKLSSEIGVSKGMLWRFIVKGWIPEDANKQRLLGIAPLIPVPACSRCGGIHTHLCKNKTRPHALQAYDVVVEDLRNREKLSKKTLSYI